MPPMGDPTSEGGVFPDIQFWKQCADPVLAQDPFSSLLSTLFCLPVQFLMSTEFFIPFVHLFYVVCVVQVCCFAFSWNVHIILFYYFITFYGMHCVVGIDNMLWRRNI